MVATPGRGVEDLRPIGRVRVRGEVWRATSLEEIEAGARIRVTGRDRLTLLVEPADET
jgi:membrane-bound ClpP family serine protease